LGGRKIGDGDEKYAMGFKNSMNLGNYFLRKEQVFEDF